MSIRHKIGKPIIHMIRKGERIPFDVIPHRAIQFALTRPDDQKEAREKLGLAVAEAIKPGFEADNPITHARGKVEFEEKASPAMKVLAGELAALRGRIDSMEAAAASANAVGRWRPAGFDYYVPGGLERALAIGPVGIAPSLGALSGLSGSSASTGPTGPSRLVERYRPDSSPTKKTTDPGVTKKSE
jgi:hypothetical protein